MKKNHEQVMAAIQRAIAECGYDDVMSEARSHLTKALTLVQTVAKKRTRHANTQKQIQMEKTKQQEWWDMLKRNASANIDLSFLEPDVDPDAN